MACLLEMDVRVRLYLQSESDSSGEVTAGVSVLVVPGGKVGSDTHLNDGEEKDQSEDYWMGLRGSVNTTSKSEYLGHL
jgi:hypothetical protein